MTDARVVAQIRARTGKIIDSPSQVEGLPAAAEPMRRALTLPDPLHRDEDGDGWTALDDWLDVLARGQAPGE